MDKKKAAATTAVTDPLEASKIQTKPPPEPLPVEPEIVAPPPRAPDVIALGPVAKYRVAKTTTISLDGQITRLNVDDVVSEESYGPRMMANILTSNVPLVKIES